MDVGFAVAWIAVPALLIVGGGTTGAVGLVKGRRPMAITGFAVTVATIVVLIRRFG